MTTLQKVDGAEPRSSAARAVTDLLSPLHLVIGVLLLVGAVSTPNPFLGLGWGLLAALFAGGLPYAFLLYGVHHGRYTDKHIRVREQRRVPLLFAVACVVTGLALLALLGAPRQLLALVIAMFVGLIVTLTITLAWKVSVHAAAAAGAAVILTLVLGPVLLISWPLVGAVGWSRVRLRDHTLAQVVAGAVMGACIAATVFSALR